MEDRRHLPDHPKHTIPILGTPQTVIEVMAALIEGNIQNPHASPTRNAILFISESNQQNNASGRQARSQPFTIIVFDQSNHESIELMQQYLEELNRYNQFAQHTFVLGVDYGHEKALPPEEVKKILSRYQKISYLEYHPNLDNDNNDSIIALRNSINNMVTAKAKQWYEWGNYYIEQSNKDTINKDLVFKALCCFVTAYQDAPHLVNHNFLILLSKLQSDGQNISEIHDDKQEIEQAIQTFEEKYPKYKKELVHIPFEQKGMAKDRQESEKILLKKAADQLKDYAHPGLFKRLERKRHVKEIDMIVLDISTQRIKNMDTLIERLDNIPDKKRSFLGCINEIRILAGEEPQPVHKSTKRNK